MHCSAEQRLPGLLPALDHHPVDFVAKERKHTPTERAMEVLATEVD